MGRGAKYEVQRAKDEREWEESKLPNGNGVQDSRVRGRRRRRKLSGQTKPIRRKPLEDTLLMSQLPQMGQKSAGKGKGRRAKYEGRKKREQGAGSREWSGLNVQNPKPAWRVAVARTIAQWETRCLGADCPHCVSAVRASAIPASARGFVDRRGNWHTVCSVPKRKALENGRTTVRRRSRRPTCGRGR